MLLQHTAVWWDWHESPTSRQEWNAQSSLASSSSSSRKIEPNRIKHSSSPSCWLPFPFGVKEDHDTSLTIHSAIVELLTLSTLLTYHDFIHRCQLTDTSFLFSSLALTLIPIAQLTTLQRSKWQRRLWTQFPIDAEYSLGIISLPIISDLLAVKNQEPDASLAQDW